MVVMPAPANWAGVWTSGHCTAGVVVPPRWMVGSQSVMVDFSSWVQGTSGGVVLGNVTGNPSYAEIIYYALDNGDGTVQIGLASPGGNAACGAE